MNEIQKSLMRLAALFLILLVRALMVWGVWNLVVPDITQGAVTSLTWLQALGVTILCQLLFHTISSRTEQD